MGSKRITRDELNRLKRKRKKQLNSIVALGVCACVLIITGVTMVVINDRPSNTEYGRQMQIGVKPDLGKSDLPAFDPYAVSSNSNANKDTDEEETTKEEKTEEEKTEESALSFEVPDTVLPPVEEIQGNDWAPKNYRRIDKIAPLEYFDNTVLIGDSRTEGIVLYSGLSNLNGFCYKGLNVGVLDSNACITLPDYGGKYTCYQAIELTKYDNYYCMFGINELGWYDISVFIDDFSQLVDKIKSVNPKATIYVEGVISVSRSKEAEGGCFTKAKVEEFNDLLLKMCKKRKDCIFLDVGAAVRDSEGYLPDEGTPDGIHCNADYCKRVLQYIRCNRYRLK